MQTSTSLLAIKEKPYLSITHNSLVSRGLALLSEIDHNKELQTDLCGLLLEIIDNNDNCDRQEALQLLRRLDARTPTSLDTVSKLMLDQQASEYLRIEAAYTVGILGDKKNALSVLYGYAQQNNPDVRVMASKYMGLLLGTEPAPRLLSILLLKEKSPLQQRKIIEALAELRFVSPFVFDVLAKVAQFESQSTRDAPARWSTSLAAAIALKELGFNDEAIDAVWKLAAQYKIKYTLPHRAAHYWYLWHPCEEAIRAQVAIACDSSIEEYIRCRALLHLKDCDEKFCNLILPTLAHCFLDALTPDSVLTNIALVMGRLGSKDAAITTLRDIIRNPSIDEGIRHDACLNLWEIGEHESARQFIDFLAQEFARSHSIYYFDLATLAILMGSGQQQIAYLMNIAQDQQISAAKRLRAAEPLIYTGQWRVAYQTCIEILSIADQDLQEQATTLIFRLVKKHLIGSECLLEIASNDTDIDCSSRLKAMRYLIEIELNL